ncbi:hypothetical protein [Streptomyces sp. DH8]|uniref:hypothetical protein n=1 Tax=Streptomyces sp. DH8 TaxID=2857008 RepID=UPI001E5265CF|nr:hypothetical protein [Streptomyces sp. DH8]
MTSTDDAPGQAAVGVVAAATDDSRAAERWLLEAAMFPQAAKSDWADDGTTFLLPGNLFGAIAVRASLVHTALLLDDPAKCGPSLRKRLRDAPVFYQENQFGREGAYVVLVSTDVAAQWDVPGSVAHHPGALLEVPAPGRIRARGPIWWVVPVGAPGQLCAPDPLAALVKQGFDMITGQLGRS